MTTYSDSVITANNSQINILGKTFIEVSFDATKNNTYKIETLVAKDLSNKLILGRKFLEENECILNFKEGIITIDDFTIEMEEKYYTSQDLPVRQEIKTMVVNYTKNQQKIGLIPNITHQIITTPNQKIQRKQYQLPDKLIKPTKDLIRELEGNKIIRLSNNGWSSPAFPIIKKNGTIRLVVDYRDLNKITESDMHPNPSIDDMLTDLNGANWFSSIDLTQGYYQIALKESHIFKTGFVILGRHYEFIRMPFGLSTAPKTFQRVISQIIADLDFIRVYLDDILIFSTTQKEHKKHMKIVLDRLKNNNISINLDKTTIMKTSIKYLGKELDGKGIKPDLTSLKKLKDISNVNTRRKLESLLGILNWFRPFIRNLSEKLLPITNKLPNKKIFLSKEDSNIINKIICELETVPRLFYPDYNKPFNLHTDASDMTIGSILSQNDKIIGIFSKKLQKFRIKL